jgi:hypothetical protein
MPPELAVVTLKRFWSDQISNERIIEVCRRYKPEQVLLSTQSLNDGWQDFLNDYEVVCQNKDFNLYVLKSLQVRFNDGERASGSNTLGR